ncbi:ABC transporter substrate-binding protein [Streptomyces cinnabarinus]|uniref:ABC transporter substrate-binding protein n=1 Tax=Streptomyces cinnabarinus TaxID=67287 RepID=A0ABY7KAF0_9ACTN|nr:ABC transporter substrate-binding protein [Streptomyces cinnabarinus]WAZ21509.1 ABC transporter substrate-binding protein [Streptomyces cinnabarinus]
MRLPEHGPAFPRSRRPLRAALALLLLLVLAAGCGYGSRAPVAAAPAVGTGPPLSAEEVSVGYFANVTHATALAGVQKGYFTRELGGTRLRTQVFNGGPSALEALNAGAVDIAWMGPSPAVNGYLRSEGRGLRIVSGAASGGVALVVDADAKVRGTDVRGLRIATPEAGNTQDVALLHWIREQGWEVDPHTGRGDVTVVRQSSKEIPTSFRRGTIDGAWVPEPVAAQLVAAGGRVLLDEADLWDDGAFVTALVVVSPSFLADHPDVVEAVLRGSVRVNAWLKSRPAEGKAAVNDAIESVTGRPLDRAVLDAAWRHVSLTEDPLAATLAEGAERADRLGLLGGSPAALDGIFDLRPLNRVLARQGEPAVDDAGLGVVATPTT